MNGEEREPVLPICDHGRAVCCLWCSDLRPWWAEARAALGYPGPPPNAPKQEAPEPKAPEAKRRDRREYWRRYYEAHREKIRERQRQRYRALSDPNTTCAAPDCWSPWVNAQTKLCRRHQRQYEARGWIQRRNR